ncbi:MAG: glutaredoxin family protein [Ktedonobacteraceae bacterium]
MAVRHTPEILLLTQQNCSFCQQAKEVLDRLSTEYDFSVAILDVASPEGQALAMRGGIVFPPGVFINDEPFSYGRLSERKLRRELERRRKAMDDGSRAV